VHMSSLYVMKSLASSSRIDRCDRKLRKKIALCD
jgi:hypothetical protein